MKHIITFLFASLLLCCPPAQAGEKAVQLNPDKPVYKADDGILSVELPPGQWNAFLLDSGAFVATDGYEGDEEYTEIRAESFPRGKMVFQAQVDGTLKGYADAFMLNVHPDQEWYETILDYRNEAYVYIREVFAGDAVYRLTITSPMTQKPSFDYAVKVTSQSFRPLPMTK